MNEPTNQNPLIIKENICFQLQNLQIEIISYLGQLTPNIDYFQVNIASEKPGLLRIGAIDSALNRELELRKKLGDYKLITELLAHSEDNITIDIKFDIKPQNTPEIETTISPIAEIDTTSEYLAEEYLAEEYYPETAISTNISNQKLLILTYLPRENQTLETWLKTEQTLEESLLITGQICQLFRYIFQREWCVINILPQFIKIGTPIEFFDLTNAYPVNEILTSGLVGNYCDPELAYCKSPIQETMSSYTVAALLYQIIHKQTLPIDQREEIEITPIPIIHQILKICLSTLPQERFTLEQLLQILVNTRQEISTPKINWEIASSSTVGLSINRLKNEDNYGIKYQKISDTETIILAAIADGMGGMSQGELASKLAIKTVLETAIFPEYPTIEQYQEWLTNLFTQANETVSNQVKEGGTTLSVIFARSQQLIISHVGDSRIYLLRQGEIKQLSEDHSLVAMLVASGQITPSQSLEHPDRNVLIKSIGTKRRLSDGYVQNLKQTTPELSMQLAHQDILLLCSDGVWDLVSKNELEEIFTIDQNLQTSVNLTINKVLERGASDNATLLALQFLVNT
ncbi:PP2C family protein-serine/threonine phosphatase [Dolichospermum circinale]|uniref:PP2C family protein-serine/threonine phosphatase n=1 Tax=Dolichospermum circinale TaxID=109265 RepID=UPI000410D215|nr:protein phosphatase 2C domain-containing protein [Dolichospermum circinale]MDB9476895.1 protein phosphatase 2C domain-containing protein [Dolichospermum circinale CS-537/11]MDB9477379.1 protein phosphatase 2C domain-containing protein [Dolichospermum circinale CS-537/03]